MRVTFAPSERCRCAQAPCLASRRAVGVLVVLLIGVASAPSAIAQTSSEPPSRHRLGPVGLDPQLAVTNFGYDSNVFNQSTDAQGDFTAAFVPAVDATLRFRRLRATGTARVGFVYFGEFTDQRFVETADRGRLEILGNRVTPFVEASYLNTRERLNSEIDVRQRRHDDTIGGGADVRVGGKTTLRFVTERFTTDYSDDGGAGLQQNLNRSEARFAGSMRFRLTPLTTFVVLTEHQRHRFDFSTSRDANTFRLTPGVEFDASALIAGRAYVGYRRFNFQSAELKDFNGLVAAVDLGYTLRGVTRFSVSVDRNLDYSFEVEEPYYIGTGAAFAVTQQITGAWSAEARLSRERLAYQSAEPRLDRESRLDHMTALGAGLGYRLSPSSSANVSLDYQRRRSLQADRDYDGVRLTTGLTYGF